MEEIKQEEQKKMKKLLFPDVSHYGNGNEITFNMGQNVCQSETRREEVSSLIENNEQISHTPSMNQQLIQASSCQNHYLTSDKVDSHQDKNDCLDSCQASNSEKDSPGLSQKIPSYIRKTSRQSRSIFLSDKNKIHLQSASKNIRVIYSFQGSQIQHSPKYLKVKLLNMIKKKLTYFKKNFTFGGRNRYLLENVNSLRKVIQDKGDYMISRNKSKVVKALSQLMNILTCFKLNNSLKQNSSYMIVPNSLVNLLSLIFFTSMNILFYFLLSIIIIFQGYNRYETSIITFIIVTWILEVFVQLNTQIYKGTNFISQREKVLAQYIKKQAFYDLIPILMICTLPQHLVLRKVFQTISFIKIKNVLPNINNMQKLLCMSVKNYYIVQLFNLIFQILVISHVIACMWYLVGQVELNLLNYETTWYDRSLGADQVWWKLYLESMYWSLTLMTTGSNVASSVPQMLFTSFIMLFTAIIFGYMLNTTGIILSYLDQKDENKRIDLNIINDYMRSNRISKGLQGRVNMDLEYYYLHNLKKDQEEKQEVLKKISPHLQNLLKVEYCRQALEKMNLISNNFSKEAISEIMIEFQEEFYSPNQIIFEEKQVHDLALIWIVQGSLQIFQSYPGHDGSKKQIQTLKSGDLVGEINFFTGQEYSYSIRALEFTKIIKIRRDKFIEIVHKRGQDYEKFCSLRDKQQFYQEYSILQYKCGFCSSSSHETANCNLIHIDLQSMISKAQFYQKSIQSRSECTRQNQRVNTYLIKQNIEKQIQKYAWQIKKNSQIDKMAAIHQGHLLSEDHSANESEEEFMPDVSSFQCLTSQVSSDSEYQKSLNEAQAVRNQSYFDQTNQLRLMNTNQNRKKKKITDTTEKELPLTPTHHQNVNVLQQNEQFTRYASQFAKRNSILAVDSFGKRNSVLFLEQNLIKNNVPEIALKRNSFLIDDSNKQIRNGVANIVSESRHTQQGSNSIYKQDSILKEVCFHEKMKVSKLDNYEKVNTPKNYNPDKQSKFNYDKKSIQLAKQTSFGPGQGTEEEQKEKKKPLFIFDFESQKNWTYYFPLNNFKNIIRRYQKHIKKRQKSKTSAEKRRNKDKNIIR